MARAAETVEVPHLTGVLSVSVVGSGPSVLLLPGGAAAARPYYPHLQQLLGDCRVITFDRPGTGTAVGLGRATLPGGALAVHSVLAALDATDAVVVGQSLGGAVTIQLLMDHPERLGGAVLIDPTPINEPRVAGMLSRGLRIAAPVTRLPGLNDSLTSRSAHRLERRLGPFDAETKACVSSMFGSASIRTTARALTTFAQDSAVLTARLTPAVVPVTLLSADRPESHRVRLAHRALAQQLGATFTSWPGSEHAMHLQFPQQLADEVTSLLPSSHEQDRSKHR